MKIDIGSVLYELHGIRDHNLDEYLWYPYESTYKKCSVFVRCRIFDRIRVVKNIGYYVDMDIASTTKYSSEMNGIIKVHMNTLYYKYFVIF